MFIRALHTMQALPGVATDPDWPPFEISFPPKRGGPKKPRTSLKPRGSDRLTPDDPAYLGPLGVDQPAAAPAPAAGAGSSRTLQIYLPWLFAAVVVVAAVVAVVCAAFRRRLCRMFVSVRAPDPHSPRTLRGGAKRKQPRMRPIGGMCWGQVCSRFCRGCACLSVEDSDVPLLRLARVGRGAEHQHCSVHQPCLPGRVCMRVSSGLVRVTGVWLRRARGCGAVITIKALCGV